MLCQSQLRPLRPRAELGELLFTQHARPISAEGLYGEAIAVIFPVSFVTVYDARTGSPKRTSRVSSLSMGQKTFVAMNISNHRHFRVWNDHDLMNIPDGQGEVGLVSEPHWDSRSHRSA